MRGRLVGDRVGDLGDRGRVVGGEAIEDAGGDEALAGLRTGIEKGVVTPLERLLHEATGYLPAASHKAMVPVIRSVADKADAWFAENASDIVPKQFTDPFRTTVGFHAMALATGDVTIGSGGFVGAVLSPKVEIRDGARVLMGSPLAFADAPSLQLDMRRGGSLRPALTERDFLP